MKKIKLFGVLGFMVLMMSNSPLWAFQTDQNIESSISNSYVFNKYLKGDNIDIHSQNGMVTLTGTVADENHKFLAENTAENMPEVKNVDNQLQVRNSVPAMYSDDWMMLKIKAVLLIHRDVSAVRTHVDVKNGIVTLSGEAENSAQKDLTALYARDVYGVKEIINNMSIKEMKEREPQSNSPIDDASITAQVKLTLLVHHSSSALRTHVKTQNGVVTLEGTASNAAEKSLVTKLVRDINGVRKVINNMDIQT